MRFTSLIYAIDLEVDWNPLQNKTLTSDFLQMNQKQIYFLESAAQCTQCHAGTPAIHSSSLKITRNIWQRNPALSPALEEPDDGAQTPS